MYLRLKDRTKEHVLTFWNKTKDEEIRGLFPFTVESLEKALILFEESMEADALSYGNVIYFEDKYIGDIWCYGVDESDEKMAMLSIVIFEKQFWGKGIGTEAVKIFITEMFKRFNIERIGAFTYRHNHGSIGMLNNAGFQKRDTFFEDEIESMYFEISYKNLL